MWKGGSGQSKPGPTPVLPAAPLTPPSSLGVVSVHTCAAGDGTDFLKEPLVTLGSRLEEVVAQTLKPGLGPCLWVVLAESRPLFPAPGNQPVLWRRSRSRP